MELKYLQTFQTILYAGSFQKAAEQLGYAQSTVTFQIQHLEQELSVQLFEKIGRKMVLTEAGKELLPSINQILNDVEQLKSRCNTTDTLHGDLTVAFPETMLLYRAQPLLKKFRSMAPNVKLTIRMPNSTDTYDMVLNGQCDLGFNYYKGSYSPSIQVHHLQSYPMVLVGSSELSPEECDFMISDAQKNSALLVGDRNSMLTRLFDDYLIRKNISVSNTIYINSIEAIKRSAASDIGIAFLPRFTVEDALEQGILQELPIDMNCSVESVYLWHKNKWVTPAMALFMRLAEEMLQ